MVGLLLNDRNNTKRYAGNPIFFSSQGIPGGHGQGLARHLLTNLLCTCAPAQKETYARIDAHFGKFVLGINS